MKELIHDTTDMEWEEARGYPAGTKTKILREGDGSHGRTVLLKFPPGWKMSAHSHNTIEQHYVLEGKYESQGREFGAGSYQLIPRETEHGPFTRCSSFKLLIFQ